MTRLNSLGEESRKSGGRAKAKPPKETNDTNVRKKKEAAPRHRLFVHALPVAKESG
jgi:hypothetical protein